MLAFVCKSTSVFARFSRLSAFIREGRQASSLMALRVYHSLPALYPHLLGGWGPHSSLPCTLAVGSCGSCRLAGASPLRARLYRSACAIGFQPGALQLELRVQVPRPLLSGLLLPVLEVLSGIKGGWLPQNDLTV